MRKIKYLFLTSIVLLLLYFVYFVTYNFVEPKVYDYMVKNVQTQNLPFDKQKNAYAHDNIIIIVIDDTTAVKYRWPWKRELFCKVFNYLRDYAQPKIVVHDALFSTLDYDNPKSDQTLFKTFGSMNNLVEGFMPCKYDWNDKKIGTAYNKKFSDKYSLKNLDIQTNIDSSLYKSLEMFPEDYFNRIKHIGSVIVNFGFIHNDCIADEILRTYDYFVGYDNHLYPSLAMETLMKLCNFPKTIITKDKIEFPEFDYTINQTSGEGRYYVPIKFYKMLNNGFSHIAIPALSVMDAYDDIIAGKKAKLPPEIFKDKIVVVGANVSASEGLWDVASTPMSSYHPGVDIQATAIDNIINNDFLTIIPKWLNIFIMLILMLFIYYTIRAHELAKALTLTFFTIFTFIAACATCFYYSVVVNIATPVVMLIVTMIIAYIHRYVIENRNKKKVENVLGKYMSEDVMKDVIQNIDNLGLGGKKAVVTVLFSDIRGFTSMSEKMSAEDVMAILNEYFSEMEPIVSKYNGIINKFIGDAVMAIFGEPIKDENHAKNAVKCGYEMLLKVQELQKKWETEGKPKIEIGVGINTGEVFVGNIGSEKRMEYTVIGDTVNLASRLESYNKQFGTKMLISSTTYEASKDIAESRKISDVQIRGKAELIDIYEIISMIQ